MGALLLLAACGSSPEPAARAPAAPDTAAEDTVVPMGRLPADVRPTRYELSLTIIPTRERFSGEVRIALELDRARRSLWLHGRELDVHQASIETADGASVAAKWEQADPEGVVELTPERPVGPGKAVLHVVWDAAFDPYRLGLYRLEIGGDAYVFSQFEPILARRAFPCFDEPGRKTPFAVTLTVPRGQAAITNTRVAAADVLPDGLNRLEFAPTDPLPTYLLAFAVGPLDVVDKPFLPGSTVRPEPLPFRGAAVRGRGPGLAYALEHTAPTLAALETWFGTRYPYQKLDIIAVPDVTFSGMENAAAIVFREAVVLLDPATASEEQRRGFDYIMAHELAHQWFGDLVTLAWWDDIWLNEAFATWMGTRVVDRLHPEYEAEASLLQSVIGAMDRDSLVAVRRVRQPIETLHDIPNAFDAITYSKGAGVLAMFERWIGADDFQRGVRRYLDEHRLGNATADDLLRALAAASGKDVVAPFRSFLDQPGVPLVEARRACDGSAPRIALRQSRYLPVGSAGARGVRWGIPVCVRYGGEAGAKERCTMLVDEAGDLPLEGEPCPAWMIPNADAAGYYRWTLPIDDLQRLERDGWPALSTKERLSVADSLASAFASAALPAADVLAALGTIATDRSRPVATAPMSLVRFVRDYVAGDELRSRAEAFARRLYAPVHARLGWEPRRDEDGETRLLRARVIGFLADVGRDPAIRRAAAERGRRLVGKVGDGRLELGAVSSDLIDVVLAVAVQEGDAAFFDGLVREVRASRDDLTRSRILTALGATHDPRLAERARALALDPDLHLDETEKPLWRQAADVETRAATWEWLTTHFDALTERLSRRRVGDTPWLASGFCDGERAADVERFFAPRIDQLAGGPRNLAAAVEAIRLCAARVEAQRPSTAAFLAR